MKIFSFKLVSLLTIFILTSIYGFSQNATHFTERAQGIADTASGQETKSAPKPKTNSSDAQTNSRTTTNAPVKSTFMFGDEKNIYSPATEMRAIWIPRGAYRKPEDIKKIVFNCANYNINTLIFQVRGNGTVFYKSKIEPWARELTGTLGQDPGWDPLQLAVDEAHANGLQLIAWLNTMPGWTGQDDPPADVPQLWNTHRDWFMKDSTGEFMIPKAPNAGWYRFLSPTIPAVQDYISSLYTEVVKNYKVDGIHFDYVRYPGEIGDYSYDSISLELFQKKFGVPWYERKDDWAQFRRDGVASVVTKTYNSVNAVNPKIEVTAAVLGDAQHGRNAHYTSSRDWFAAGVMDITMTMGYTGDTVKFREMNQEHINNAHGRFVCPGIGVGGKWANTPQLLTDEIQIAREIGGQGVTFFSYNSMFPNHNPNELAETLLKGLFARPAVPPTLPWKK